METSNYAEVVVYRETKKLVIRYFIFAVILSIYISFGMILLDVTPLAPLVFAVIAIVGCILIWRQKDIEYEYVICDGKVTFARIRGNVKRKVLLKADLYEAVYLGPSDCDEIIQKKSEITNYMNFTSRRPDAKEYTLIQKYDNRVYAIRFEPNEKFLDCARWKMNRRYKLYDEDKEALMKKENS